MLRSKWFGCFAAAIVSFCGNSFAAADIALVGGLHFIPAGSGEGRVYASTDLPEVVINTTRPMKLRVYNLGDQNLTITLPIAIGGLTGSQFSVTQNPDATIAPGQSSPFTITYAPTSTGFHEAVITVSSNDPDEGSFLFIVQGTGITAVIYPQPDVSVSQVLPPVLKCNSKGVCKFSGSLNLINNSNIPFNGGMWYLSRLQEEGFSGRYSELIASGTVKKVKAWGGDPAFPSIKKFKYKASLLTAQDTRFALLVVPNDAGYDPDYTNNWILLDAQ
ncbi:MAG: choice-of-anchor D domain-containing protein [Candidatus Sumerlaeaceae bacterium]